MDAELLSYSRSRGSFGGVSLKGPVISPDESDMEGTYGNGIKAETILAANKSRAPSEVRVFPKGCRSIHHEPQSERRGAMSLSLAIS